MKYENILVDVFSKLIGFVLDASDEIRNVSRNIVVINDKIASNPRLKSYIIGHKGILVTHAKKTFITTYTYSVPARTFLASYIVEKGAMIELDDDLYAYVGGIYISGTNSTILALKKGFLEETEEIKTIKEIIGEIEEPILNYTVVEEASIGEKDRIYLDERMIREEINRKFGKITKLNTEIIVNIGAIYRGEYEKLSIYLAENNPLSTIMPPRGVFIGGKYMVQLYTSTVEAAPKLAETLVKQIVKYAEYIYG